MLPTSQKDITSDTGVDNEGLLKRLKIAQDHLTPDLQYSNSTYHEILITQSVL